MISTEFIVKILLMLSISYWNFSFDTFISRFNISDSKAKYLFSPSINVAKNTLLLLKIFGRMIDEHQHQQDNYLWSSLLLRKFGVSKSSQNKCTILDCSQIRNNMLLGILCYRSTLLNRGSIFSSDYLFLATLLSSSRVFLGQDKIWHSIHVF